MEKWIGWILDRKIAAKGIIYKCKKCVKLYNAVGGALQCLPGPCTGNFYEELPRAAALARTTLLKRRRVMRLGGDSILTLLTGLLGGAGAGAPTPAAVAAAAGAAAAAVATPQLSCMFLLASMASGRRR